jgi:hypothetical protein
MPKTSSKRFANHLTLMVDETFGKPVADALNKNIAFVRARTTFDCGFVQGTVDQVLIREGKRLGRVLLTYDKTTINEKHYPPCSHAGIIIIKDGRWSSEKIVKEVKALARSGNRRLASHNVIHLHHDHAVIHKHNGEKQSVRFRG